MEQGCKGIYKYIIFDFDGVLAETNKIRLEGFRLLFKGYPKNKVDLLVRHAMANGGLSRYEKVKYFFEEILKEPISPQKIKLLTRNYSKLVKEKVIKAKPVKGSLEFLSRYYNKYKFAIVSGSDEKELKEVCNARMMGHFFLRIKGSPESKESNLSKLLKEMKWEKKMCVYIGDSINDLEAAKVNRVDFIACNSNNMDWPSLGVPLISDLSYLSLYLK